MELFHPKTAYWKDVTSKTLLTVILSLDFKEALINHSGTLQFSLLHSPSTQFKTIFRPSDAYQSVSKLKFGNSAKKVLILNLQKDQIVSKYSCWVDIKKLTSQNKIFKDDIVDGTNRNKSLNIYKLPKTITKAMLPSRNSIEFTSFQSGQRTLANRKQTTCLPRKNHSRMSRVSGNYHSKS